MNRTREREESSQYDVDFYEWTQRIAEALREGRLSEADAEHAAEEIADIGKRDRREIRSRILVLLAHLLKWDLQPKLRSSSWRATITEQRQQLYLLFEDSPSLRSIATDELPLLFMRAVNGTLAETGLHANVFPTECPYSSHEILSDNFFPDGRISSMKRSSR